MCAAPSPANRSRCPTCATGAWNCRKPTPAPRSPSSAIARSRSGHTNKLCMLRPSRAPAFQCTVDERRQAFRVGLGERELHGQRASGSKKLCLGAAVALQTGKVLLRADEHRLLPACAGQQPLCVSLCEGLVIAKGDRLLQLRTERCQHGKEPL